MRDDGAEDDDDDDIKAVAFHYISVAAPVLPFSLSFSWCILYVAENIILKYFGFEDASVKRCKRRLKCILLPGSCKAEEPFFLFNQLPYGFP